MRILHVVPTYVPAWRYGGPIRSVHGLCKALASRGHQVDVATTNVDGDNDSDVPLGVPVDLDGVRVHYFRSRHLRRLYYSPPMYQYMKRGMEGWDVVHNHSVYLWPTAAAAHLARKLGKPYVLSPRGMLVKDLIGRRSGLVKRAWIRLIERRNVERAEAIHVTSPIEGRELIALAIKPKRMFEIPNGYDMPVRSDYPVAPADHLPEGYVLFLGRISWVKGIDRLISAMALASDLTLVMAGPDDEGYQQKMLDLAKALSIEGRVRYIGTVEGAKKDALIAQAAMLVLPSYSENFGNVVLESMAMGVPVIVTPEVGLSEAVQSSRSGLVARGEPHELGGAIRRLADDANLRAELGANGREAAKAYSWDSVARRMEEQYRNVIEQHG